MPKSDPVKAVVACRNSFNDFWDKLLTLSEKHGDYSTVATFVKLIKSMFDKLPDTYTDDKTGWTYPSDIVEATMLVTIGCDLVGDGTAFGILLNEIECISHDRSVTTEFQSLDGSTYGELFRMTAVRFLLEILKEDEEVLATQTRRLKLANQANDAAGLTGLPPARGDMSKLHHVLWEQLRQYLLNEAIAYQGS